MAFWHHSGNYIMKDLNKISNENKIEKKEEYNPFSVKQLTNENTKLKDENTNLKDENTNLKNENTKLKDENTKLKDENTNLKNENTNLKAELDFYKSLFKTRRNSCIFNLKIKKMNGENVWVDRVRDQREDFLKLDMDEEVEEWLKPIRCER